MKNETATTKTMVSQVNTIDELMTLISWQGVPTDLESICRMQDIVGHTPVDRLIELANDTGLEIRDGDQWSTGRRGTRDAFYHLLTKLWSWEDVTRFWNAYTNPDHIAAGKAAKLEKENKRLLQQVQVQADEAAAKQKETDAALIDLSDKLLQAGEDLKAKELEILKLKARVYDLEHANK